MFLTFPGLSLQLIPVFPTLFTLIFLILCEIVYTLTSRLTPPTSHTHLRILPRRARCSLHHYLPPLLHWQLMRHLTDDTHLTSPSCPPPLLLAVGRAEWAWLVKWAGLAYITGGVEEAPASLTEESLHVIVDGLHDLGPVQTLDSFRVLLVT